MKGLIRRHLLEAEPYKPVQPLEALAERLGIPVQQIIKLDANESPYGCSPRVLQAFAETNSYHIYPDPEHRELRTMLEEYTGVGREYIAVGSGSDELIDLILRMTLEPGEKVINFPPTFVPYGIRIKMSGGKIINIPRGTEFGIDVEKAKSAIDKSTKVILLANPNNPTGNMTPVSEIISLLETGIFVVVDEAYYEFSGETVAHFVPSYPNLIVLRSFSKWAGLAGLRVGYGIFNPEVREIIYKSKLPYNVSSAAQLAAIESLRDLGNMKRRIEAITSERARLSKELKQQGILAPYPSQANFILCQAVNGDAAQIKGHLEQDGIFIRYFDTPMLRNMVRITVGKPEHTNALIKSLNKLSQQS